MIKKFYGPPGTGKTEKLIRRALAYVRSGTDIKNIGYFAFTKKAANTAKERMLNKNRQFQKKDLKYFQKLTTQKHSAVIMGFNTWKSLPTFPEPLPNRATYVVTKNNVHLTRATLTFPEPPELDWLKRIQMIHPNIWICGGEKIYNYYYSIIQKHNQICTLMLNQAEN